MTATLALERGLPHDSPAAQMEQLIRRQLEPHGVGVVIEAVHLCMMMRGVEKQNSRTITSALRGKFRDCPMTRNEFLSLAHGTMARSSSG